MLLDVLVGQPPPALVLFCSKGYPSILDIGDDVHVLRTIGNHLYLGSWPELPRLHHCGGSSGFTGFFQLIDTISTPIITLMNFSGPQARRGISTASRSHPASAVRRLGLFGKFLEDADQRLHGPLIVFFLRTAIVLALGGTEWDIQGHGLAHL